MKGTIIAAGGMEFSNGVKQVPGYALEDYIVRCVDNLSSICFMPTASAENSDYVISFYKTFSRFKCSLTHLSLFKLPTPDLRSFVMDQSIVVVGGGNTKSMLALWKAWGIDAILHDYWLQGGILAGTSAGALCWFEEGTTDSVPGSLTILKCLGFLKGSLSPHFDDQKERKPTYRRLIDSGNLKPGIGLDKYAALHYQNTRLIKTLSFKDKASAYLVEQNCINILCI